MAFDRLGEESRALQLRVVLTGQGQTVPFFADLILFRYDRTVGLSGFSWSYNADTSTEQEMTDAMAERAASGSQGASAAALGTTVTTAHGNRLSVDRADWWKPAKALYITPDPGTRFFVAQVHACAAADNTSAVTVSTSDFTLKLDDDSSLDPVGGREPALQDTQLQPGDFTRGWLTFHVPKTNNRATLEFGDLKFAVSALGSSGV
jgi:hypothetical protein